MSHTVTLLSMCLYLQVSIAKNHWSGLRPLVCAGPSLERLLVILLLPCVMQILQLWVCMTSPFTCSIRSQMGWILVLGLGSCRVGYPTSSALSSSSRYIHCLGKFTLCRDEQELSPAVLFSCPQLCISHTYT